MHLSNKAEDGITKNNSLGYLPKKRKNDFSTCSSVNYAAFPAGAGVYQPWCISTAFFLLARRDFLRAPVFLCSVPTFTALSITEYASAISFSIEKISSACASGFFLSTSSASKTLRKRTKVSRHFMEHYESS